MKRPNIRGLKTKAIRIDPIGLALFREELKGDPEWAEYAEVSESELVTLAVTFARVQIRPDVYVMTLESVNSLVDEAIRINIGEVARALGGVAQLNPDKTISVTRPEADGINTFKAKPVTVRRPPMIH